MGFGGPHFSVNMRSSSLGVPILQTGIKTLILKPKEQVDCVCMEDITTIATEFYRDELKSLILLKSQDCAAQIVRSLHIKLPLNTEAAVM